MDEVLKGRADLEKVMLMDTKNKLATEKLQEIISIQLKIKKHIAQKQEQELKDSDEKKKEEKK